MGEYTIHINNVTKSYMDGMNQRKILDEVSLKVKPSEFVAITGPSGSGKSTLLSIAGALLSPESGSVIIGGRNIGKGTGKDWNQVRRESLGFVFQNHQLIPYLTVEEQLKLITRLSPKDTSALGKEILQEFGLYELRTKYPEQLSGGERQRVAIARAFMNDPKVILADEPTASLDKERGRQVVEMIVEEVKKREKAAIMVTHDERILDLVDTIYRLEDGRLTKVNH